LVLWRKVSEKGLSPQVEKKENSPCEPQGHDSVMQETEKEEGAFPQAP